MKHFTNKKYRDYLRSKEWRDFKRRYIRYLFIIGRAYCIKCKTPYKKGFPIHHKSYRNFGNETFDDVELFCHKHHRRYHKKKRKKWRYARKYYQSLKKKYKMYKRGLNY
jgi:hypothetical protein